MAEDVFGFTREAMERVVDAVRDVEQSTHPRPQTASRWPSAAPPQWLRVKLTTTAQPRQTFNARVTAPKDTTLTNPTEADLWEDTDLIIEDIYYGLPSNDTLPVGTIGWILHRYRGRPVLVIAECP